MRARSAGLIAAMVVAGCGGDGEEPLPNLPTTGQGGAATTGSGPTGSGASTSGAGGSTSTGMQNPCDGGPLAAPIAGCAPEPPPSTGDFAQDCVDRINQLRWECQCLPPLERWTDAETCSDEQSSADQNGGGAHANFGDCNENAQNTCPNWGSPEQVIGGCLQMMWDEGPGEDFQAHGHYINMSSTSYGRVACGIAGDGQIWSNQNFKN